MKNHLNILPKLASFDLKCSKMRWLRPRPRWGSLRRSPDPLIVRGNAPSALGTLYFVSIFTSQFPFRAPLTEFLDPPLYVFMYVCIFFFLHLNPPFGPPLRNSWIRHCMYVCMYVCVCKHTCMCMYA